MTTKDIVLKRTTRPSAWTVNLRETGQMVGSIEWHGELGYYGLALLPGIRADLGEDVVRGLWRIVDKANAEVDAADRD